jgi:dephospho-CoA kinase
MKWIGLTGGLATGKSTVSQMLKSWGYPVIDADQIAKDVVDPGSLGLQAVVSQFGPHILDQFLTLDRAKLAQIVFSNSRDLKKLEEILHPLIQAEVQKLKKFYKAKGARILFYDVPLLFEKNIVGFDAVILVSADLETSTQRAMQRDHSTREQVLAKMRAQLPIEEKKLKADFVIENKGTLDDLKSKVLQILKTIDQIPAQP